MPLINQLRLLRHWPFLPLRSRVEVLRDHWHGPVRNDASREAVMAAVLRWLGEAQDHSRHGDGGFARHYSLIKGWASSYPETTGYIIPTLLDIGEATSRDELVERARRALDWLVGIQFPDGGFQGGLIDSTPAVPVTFNTGQILLGLAAGAARWPDRYQEPMVRAATWLRDSQEADGSWSRHPTPFAAPGHKVYETHVAWGLLEADRVAPGMGFGEAGLRNIRWALTRQRNNGWFDDCCLEEARVPLTHTIGYALRGIIAGWQHSGSDTMLEAARRTAAALESTQRPDGALPGRLDAQWQPTVEWSCMTGNVQVAECWALLAEAPGASPTWRNAARAAITFVRRSILLDAPAGMAGGVKGSWPVDGGYGRMQFLNWAAKFYLDAERALDRIGTGPDGGSSAPVR